MFLKSKNQAWAGLCALLQRLGGAGSYFLELMNKAGLSVVAQHYLCLHARNSRKHNSSDGYAAAIWMAAARKARGQDVYRQYRVKRQQPRTWGTAQVLW